MRRFLRDGWDFGVFTIVIGVPVAITLVALIAYIVVNGFAAMPKLVASNPGLYGPIVAINLFCVIMFVRALFQMRTNDQEDESESNG